MKNTRNRILAISGVTLLLFFIITSCIPYREQIELLDLSKVTDNFPLKEEIVYQGKPLAASVELCWQIFIMDSEGIIPVVRKDYLFFTTRHLLFNDDFHSGEQSDILIFSKQNQMFSL